MIYYYKTKNWDLTVRVGKVFGLALTWDHTSIMYVIGCITITYYKYEPTCDC